MNDEKIESVIVTGETENTKKENEANDTKSRKPRSDKGKPHNWKNKVPANDNLETVENTVTTKQTKIKPVTITDSIFSSFIFSRS